MNNNQIDNTDYYRLPSGRQLEDFMAARKLSFAEGSALKYLFRAGKKDGESTEKDRAKAEHYIRFIARYNGVDEFSVRNHLYNLLRIANGENTADGFLSHHVLSRIGQHYVKAIEKHPHFCDNLLPEKDSTIEVSLQEAIKIHLDHYRRTVEVCTHNGNLLWNDILDCEKFEAIEAMANGDTAAAVDECFDAIAVLLRVIDILEGRQPLGKPEGRGDLCHEN